MCKKKKISFFMICISILCLLTACGQNKQEQNEEKNQNDLILDRAYITRYEDINEVTYPKFVFNYPSNWNVINERVDNMGETIKIKSDDGVEITYNYMNLPESTNLGTGTDTMLKVDISEITKSDFNAGYVQATDYSNLGKFMVSKLHVIGQLDMKNDADFTDVDGSISYALLPQSMSGIKDDVTGAFSGEFSFYYGGYISMLCTPENKLNEKQEKEVVEIMKSFRKLEDAKETYVNSNNALTLSTYLSKKEPTIMYYFNFDNLYNRKEITSETKVDTLSNIVIFEGNKAKKVFITHAFENWDSLTVGDILSLTNEEIMEMASNEQYTDVMQNFIITGSTLENKDVLEKEKIWIKADDTSIIGIPDFMAPIELEINNNYYAGFWKSDSRGSEVMVFKTNKNEYFTFDDKKDILLNPNDSDIQNVLK